MKTFKLLWIVGGKVREELFRNETKTRCRWMADRLKRTTHRSGKLLIVENDLKLKTLVWKS